jgi:diguanylate cyclase (GGDEF)-like protein/PAS domain S-box-containing protein
MNKTMPHEKQFFAAVFDHVQDGIITIDPELVITFMNPAAERMSAINNQDVQGCRIHQIFTLIESQSLFPLIPTTLIQVENFKGPVLFKSAILQCRRGDALYVEGSISQYPSAKSGSPGYVLVFRDVSKMKKLSTALEYHAQHDLLTGMLNRIGLIVQLEEMLNAAKLNGTEHTLLEINLDRFGEIINALGFFGAEEILKQLANVLRSVIQRHDLSARLSSDTFILGLRDCSSRDAVHVAGRIRETIHRHVFKFQRQELFLSFNMGMASLNDGDDNIEAILRAADTACFRARQEDRNQIARNASYV